MRPASQIPFWTNVLFPPSLNKSVLSCSGNIQGELLASFDFYAEINEIGKRLLKSNHHPNPNKSFGRFQAYIRQAKTFYETAEFLHHRASPLNYYYSFMNLAKALIFVRDPTFVDHNLKHGIIQKPQNGLLRRQRVIVKKAGVFPKFYETTTRNTLLNNSSLSIVDLLSYVSDVAFEYVEIKYGSPSSFRTKIVFCSDAQKLNVFPLMAINTAQSKRFKTIEKRLTKIFDEVMLPPHILKNVFELKAEVSPHFRYFEGKPVPVNSPLDKMLAGISDYISPNPFNDDIPFLLNSPIRAPKLSTMNEMHSIYIIMFFLGSLVRYRPDLLENMLSTKDAWILERFIKSAPLTFLRYARNLLDGRYLVYTAR
jgi:hypothetical protein